MKIKRMIVSFATLLMLLMCFCGCNKTESNTIDINKKITAPEHETAEAGSEEVTEADQSEDNTDNKTLRVVFSNECGSDFGLIAMFDPTTSEQMNLDALLADEEITMDLNWPVEAKTLKWGVYDTEGNLLADCDTDVTKAEGYIKICLIGDGHFENIDVQYE